MSYKPDENILISYLYGELDEKECVELEAYLEEHPDVKEKLRSMANGREIIGAIKDKEVIAPPVFLDDYSSVRSIWQSTYFKTVVSIAASFLLLMVAGRIIGIEIQYSQGELRISFGGAHQIAAVQNLQAKAVTQDEVQSMINLAMVRTNQSITANWVEEQKKIDQSVRQRLEVNSKKMDNVIKNASQTSQDQVSAFVAGLQRDNLRLMKDYLQLSSTEQKKYVETLLVDFSKYLQEQRNQDLNLFQTRMNSIEKNSDQFKQETEQILSSIISTASVTKKKNSY